MEVLEFKQAEVYKVSVCFADGVERVYGNIDGIDLESDPFTIQVVDKNGWLMVLPKRNIFSLSIGPEDDNGTDD